MRKNAHFCTFGLKSDRPIILALATPISYKERTFSQSRAPFARLWSWNSLRVLE